MHILELPSFFRPHGGNFCLEQSRALKSLGHDVRILSCTQLAVTTDRFFYFNSPRGCWWEDIDGIDCYLSFVHGVPKMVRMNQQRWVARVLSMYADYKERFGRPDLIHAHCSKWAGVAAQQLALHEGIPYYITEHLSSILYRRDFGNDWELCPWAKPLIREAMESAQCVIPVSDELVEDLRPFFGDKYRYRTVSNIVDVNFFARRDWTVANGVAAPDAVSTSDGTLATTPKFRFVCLARADVHGKGFDVLADALADNWLATHDAELHIAGRGTRSLRSLFPQREVILHGELDKNGVRDLLWQCDALVLPTRCEAQSLVLLEAMSCGLPVVTTEAVPQIVRIPGACTVVPIGDAGALADAMSHVMTLTPDPAWVEQAREIVSPQAVARRLEAIFMER